MKCKDWLVTEEGECQVRPSAREWNLIRNNYYFHRFLTDVVDLLDRVAIEAEQWDYLPQIRTLVRKLLINSYWLKTQYLEPAAQTGISIRVLYDEIGYPLTVQNVTFAPGVISPIHNHGTWGVVAVLQGQEKHTFWRRVNDPKFPNKIEPVGEKIVTAGEIISFVPGAIHQVEAVGDEPVVTFHLYGDTLSKARFKFDPETCNAINF
ncbi:cupin [Candidatus Gracilibacteria bacterium]|nr:cupin [Candidatus Gracilibacteria bacterium]NJM89950.1 cupin [Hydrococcus sp. RU_2_2]NJP22207.1 cupin [Hydrococcus sp. CRU_1_1]